MKSQSSEQIVTIKLFGETYKFKAEDEVLDAQRVADFLVDEVKRVEDQMGGGRKGITKFALLLLATMNISNEYFDLKRVHEKLREEVFERNQELLKTLDAQAD